jgi:hypothetical protein
MSTATQYITFRLIFVSGRHISLMPHHNLHKTFVPHRGFKKYHRLHRCLLRQRRTLHSTYPHPLQNENSHYLLLYLLYSRTSFPKGRYCMAR